MFRPDLNAAAIDYRIDRMNQALPDARQGPAPDELIESMPINAKDRHVLALAAHIEADCVITFDLSDFPTALCEPSGVEPLHPDELLDAFSASEPHRTITAVREIAARRRRPPMTAAQLLDRLAATIRSSSHDAQTTLVGTCGTERERFDPQARTNAHRYSRARWPRAT